MVQEERKNPTATAVTGGAFGRRDADRVLVKHNILDFADVKVVSPEAHWSSIRSVSRSIGKSFRSFPFLQG